MVESNLKAFLRQKRQTEALLFNFTITVPTSYQYPLNKFLRRSLCAAGHMVHDIFKRLVAGGFHHTCSDLASNSNGFVYESSIKGNKIKERPPKFLNLSFFYLFF